MTEIDYNFVVESGDFIIMIGSFSDSKDLKTISIPVDQKIELNY
jgi:hypothetical protein